MSAHPFADEARVTVTVPVRPEKAFQIFTQEIDQWWRRGVRFRASGAERGVIRLEPGVGGRLFESVDQDSGAIAFEVGRVTLWEPPHRLMFHWRAQNFLDGERTEVEVLFKARGSKTIVELIHRGFASLRADHPVRHGLDGRGTIRMIGLWWRDQFESLLQKEAGS